jgi:hypothetical protein
MVSLPGNSHRRIMNHSTSFALKVIMLLDMTRSRAKPARTHYRVQQTYATAGKEENCQKYQFTLGFLRVFLRGSPLSTTLSG